MRNDLTDITVVTDRSGSMEECRLEAENGINHFIEEQKKLSGEALFSLIQFDTEYEFVHRGTAIAQVGRYKLVPRGMTALLDAMGRSINEAGDRLSKMSEDQRPGLVVFVIVTDGQENASHEFTRNQIKGTIERQQKEYNWQFTFLGANQDAFAEAASLGIVGAAATFTVATVGAAYRSSSNNVARMRNMSAGGQSVKNFYTPEELKDTSGK